MNDYYLLSGDTIEILENGDSSLLIRQPRISELLKYDIDLDGIISPFYVFKEALNVDKTELHRFKNFDLVLFDYMKCKEENMVDKSKLEGIKNSLVYLCATNNVKYDVEIGSIVVNGIHVINRDNFDTLQRTILEMFYKKRPEFKTNSLTNFQQNKVNELLKRRAAKNKKEESSMMDMINIVVHGGDNFISYCEVLGFTYWQFLNTYMSILKKQNYYEYLRYASSGQFQMKEKIEHWTKQLKIENYQ